MENKNQTLRSIKILRNSIIPIGLVSISFGAVFFGITEKFIPAQYESTIQLVGKSKQSSSDDVTSANFQLLMVNTYKGLTSSSLVLNEAKNKIQTDTNKSFSTEELQSMLSVDAEDNSRIFQVNAIYKNPRVAQNIAQNVGEALVEQVEPLLGEGTNLSIISPAQTPLQPVSPNTKLNAVFGMLLGMLLSVGVIYFRGIQSSTLEEFDFIGEDLGLRNLGSIANQSKVKDISKRKIETVRVIQKENIDEKTTTRRHSIHRP